MKFDCAHCGQNLQCPEDLVGSAVKCPSCNHRLVVPSPEPPPPEGPSASSTKRKVRVGPRTGAASPSATSGSPRPTPAPAPREDPTNINMLAALGIGVGIGIGFYLVLLPFSKTYLAQLFFERGWIPHALTLLTGWAVGILILKYRKLQWQSRALLLDVLPTDLSMDISPDQADEFLAHIRHAPPRMQSSFMVRRMRLGLQHFQVRKSNPEVAALMLAQSEMDAASVQSSYAMLKIFLWAIPILGFIGTVLGISDAVGGFSGSLDSAQDIDVLKSSLNDVTSGLSVAFDTTLVALVLSLIISFPASALQKAEEEMLGGVDAACNENLLKRLNDAGGLADVALNTEAIMQSIGQAVTVNQQDVLDQFAVVQERMEETITHQQTMITELAEAMRAQIARMEESARDHQKNLADGVTRLTTPFEDTMKALARQGESAGANSAEALRRQSDAIEQSTSRLAEALGNLNTVLSELGGKQIVIEKKGGIWPFRR